MPVTWTSYARLIVDHRRVVVTVYLLGLAVLAPLSVGAVSGLETAGFDDSGSQSAQVAASLREQFDTSDPAAVLLVRSDQDVDPLQIATAGRALAQSIARLPGVATVASSWTSANGAALRSPDGRAAQILVFSTPTADRQQLSGTLVSSYSGTRGDLTVYVYGSAVVAAALNDTSPLTSLAPRP